MMDNLLIQQYERALGKSLDALLMAVSALALATDNAVLKSTQNPPKKNISNANPASAVGATYKKRSTAFLDTGEERTFIETYRLNTLGVWELVDMKIEDAPGA